MADAGGACYRDGSMMRALTASTLLLLGLGLTGACNHGTSAVDVGDDDNAKPDAASSGNPPSSGGSSGASSSGQAEAGPPYQVPACVGAEGTDADPTWTDDPNAPAGVTPPATPLKSTATTTGANCTRSFQLRTTAALRDANPSNPRTVTETTERPSVQTKNALFDALYQLALTEADEEKVAAIQDFGFNDGKPVACGVTGCFETGRKWNYVWTRDTSYATNLGLAWTDPARAAASLDFKLSPRRDGSAPEIVQDTGTGGSWPVSSDRVVWSLGASTALLHLDGDARSAFATRALEALENTLAHDADVVLDARDGLYRGEQSFLDWRTQTYPAWVLPDLQHIASSKSLSTNVLHLWALQTAQDLAQRLGRTDVDHHAQIDALRTAIHDTFWLEGDQQYSTFVTTDLDGSAARRFDLLGTSLAILAGVGTDDQARAALSSYPVLPKGPPVIFPEQQNTPIYHNRAVWPFVTAYWMRAAKKVGHDAAYDAAAHSLVRGAALNLSNLENLELVTGTAYVDDGANSGPVVNSQRQLWSVAAYLGMVNEHLFGLVPRAEGGLTVSPYVTGGIHRDLFGGATSVALNRVPWHGKTVSVRLRLPTTVAEGGYVVTSVTLNGQPSSGAIDESQLGAANLVEVELGAPTAAPLPLRRIDDVSDYRVLYAPKTPSAAVSLVGGKLQLAVDLQGESSVTYAVYRDGVRVADAVTGGTWVDQDSSASSPSHCYTVESSFGTGTVSQRANPTCFWGASNERVVTIGADAFAVVGGAKTTQYGQTFYEAWGDPEDSITASFTAEHPGEHLVAATYGNGAGPVDTGISCGLKSVKIERVSDGAVVGGGTFVMPQRGDWASWGESTFVRATLEANVGYRVRIFHDAASTNMTGFSHFAIYTAGTGGKTGPNFRVNVAAVKLLWLGR